METFCSSDIGIGNNMISSVIWSKFLKNKKSKLCIAFDEVIFTLLFHILFQSFTSDDIRILLVSLGSSPALRDLCLSKLAWAVQNVGSSLKVVAKGGCFCQLNTT